MAIAKAVSRLVPGNWVQVLPPLVDDGNYFFVPAFVLVSLTTINRYSIEIPPPALSLARKC